MASLEQQAYEYSQKKYDEYKAQQDQLDAAANEASGKRTAARIQLNAAKESGDGAAIYSAQIKYDEAKAASVVASEQANNNLIRLQSAENAVEHNGVLAANAAKEKEVGVSASSATTSVVDPAAQQATAKTDQALDTPTPVNETVTTTPYETSTVESVAPIENTAPPTQPYVIPGIQGGPAPVLSAETTEPYVSGQTGFPVDETLAATPAPADAYVAGQTGIPIDDKYVNPDGQVVTDQDVGGPSTSSVTYTQGQGENRNQVVFPAQKDWRFRIQLAPMANYLYKDPDTIKNKDTDILGPLVYTEGVVFPYTPQISLSYAANYDATDLAHTNYKIYQYRNSNVGDIAITAEFTAQDTNEANYMLAVLHFFKCVTKMFYGKDQDPRAGTPPPLVYLSGFGEYQFDYHPVAITSFGYTMPNDVDYIRAGVVQNMGGTNNQASRKEKQLPATNVASLFSSFFRLNGSGLRPGAGYARPNFTNTLINQPSYVPTKLTINLNCIPMISRYNMANKFSLKEYATGSLLKGSTRSTGGMW